MGLRAVSTEPAVYRCFLKCLFWKKWLNSGKYLWWSSFISKKKLKSTSTIPVNFEEFLRTALSKHLRATASAHIKKKIIICYCITFFQLLRNSLAKHIICRLTFILFPISRKYNLFCFCSWVSSLVPKKIVLFRVCFGKTFSRAFTSDFQKEKNLFQFYFYHKIDF